MNDTTQKVLEGDSKIILEALGLQNLPEEDRAEVLSALMKHLESVIIETIVTELSPEQVEEFQDVLKGHDLHLEERIEEITAHVPGLAHIVEETVAHELEVFRKAYTGKDA